MYVTILGWKSSGLRCPDMVMSFEAASNKHQINLVQMPNGTGKSTIIELINAALVNEAFSKQKVRDLQKTDKSDDQGYFILDMGLRVDKDSNIENITYQIDFDFANCQASYSTLRDSKVGLEKGWNPPSSLKPFLNNRCVEVFVFKGDRAENLINRERNDAEASISAFFGLSEIAVLMDMVENDFSTRQKSKIGAHTDQGLQQKSTIIINWEKQLEKLQKERSGLITEQALLDSAYENKRQQMQRALDADHEKNIKLIVYLDEHKAAVRRLSLASTEALSALRNPLFVSRRIGSKLILLKQNLDMMKLPGTSGEFFQELSQNDICVCDRVMDEVAKMAVLRNASSFLSDNHVMIVNGIKRDVSRLEDKAEFQRGSNPFVELKCANDELHLAEQNYRRHFNKIRDEGTNEHRTALLEWQELIEKKALNQKEIDILDGEGPLTTDQASSGKCENCKSIPTVKRVISKRQGELAESNQSAEEFKCMKKLVRILESVKTKSLKKLSIELRDRSNEKLRRILVEGTQLEIVSIDKNITIGFAGKSQSRASGGQEVSIAYSFATSILERSGAQFPLIVDHPVTALQASARRVMGETISGICHQFIGFIIDTERADFLPSLERNADSLNLTTVFKNVKGNEPYLSSLPLDTSKYTTSEDGIVCKDVEFFKNFSDLHIEKVR